MGEREEKKCIIRRHFYVIINAQAISVGVAVVLQLADMALASTFRIFSARQRTSLGCGH